MFRKKLGTELQHSDKEHSSHMNKITNSQIKRTNRNNIYTAIYDARQISKQQLADQLGLSMPTITQNLKELEALDLIRKDGFFESSSVGGRKAHIITCNAAARIAIGVEVLKEKAFIIALDLYGNKLAQETLDLPFQKSDLYFCALGNWINRFIAELPYPLRTQKPGSESCSRSEVILGVGIAIQGLVSSDHRQILYGKLMDCTGVTLEEMTRYIKWPCMLIHDSEAAAFSELWLNTEINDSLYLWLNYNLGSALIVNGRIHTGRGYAGGTIEHMQLVPEGRPCYCGKKGCVESYCSADALKEAAKEPLEEFFRKLRAEDGQPVSSSRRTIWQQYLRHLATALNNVLMVADCDIIFSGALQPYLMEEDLEEIYHYLKELSPFPFYEPRLKMSVSEHRAAAVGAALYQVTHFLNEDEVFQ